MSISTCRKGTVLGLLGPNGAGKTTIVRTLATIVAPDAGRAEVMGHDVRREPDAVRRLIGLAGQSAAIDPNLTGRENLRLVGRLAQLPGKQATARADELLQRFGLTTVGNQPTRTYSGGMRRRLDLAASLAHHPPVILLDEPTTGLDLASRENLWTMVRELGTEGTTVRLTTQYLEEADRLADRIVVVAEGRIVANDTPIALKAELGNTVIEISMSTEADAVNALDVLSHTPSSRGERVAAAVRLNTQDGASALLTGVHSRRSMETVLWRVSIPDAHQSAGRSRRNPLVGAAVVVRRPSGAGASTIPDST